ncbi:MAG: hypothetical protein DMG70_01795 [Acidobacteria bacterium]|nr:MAG: hypothetical protein DMG70_01795 [Acidobacteriota bacterium]
MNCGLALPSQPRQPQQSSRRQHLSTMGNEQQRTFKSVYAAGAVILVVITVFAVTLAVQEHNDRVLSEEITGTASELQHTGARIAPVSEMLT